jgi:hypothetical protein
MGTVFNSAVKVGRHVAIWVVWQSTGTNLISRG